jgi:hypothetical protein
VREIPGNATDFRAGPTTLDETLVDAMAEAARTVLAQWQEEHGPFTPGEPAAARAEEAGADIAYLRGSGDKGAA